MLVAEDQAGGGGEGEVVEDFHAFFIVGAAGGEAGEVVQSQKPETRGQRSEVRRRKPETRSQKPEKNLKAEEENPNGDVRRDRRCLHARGRGSALGLWDLDLVRISDFWFLVFGA